MRIAVVNETSAADKNEAIMIALDGRGFDVFNVGMKKNGAKPELSTIQTGLITAMLLNLNRVDFVVGGCGTGQGYMLSAMKYPGVYCGHIITALDAWLFTQINAGNCISLALNQGYGWAGDVNLRFIFDRIFSVEKGGGYPSYRKDPQRQYRLQLEDVDKTTHIPFAQIIETLPDHAINPALEYPGMLELIDVETIEDEQLKMAFEKRIRS